MKSNYLLIIFLLLAAAGKASAGGGSLIEFVPNTPATAGEVNTNFTLLESRLNDLETALMAANQTIAALENELATVTNNSVLSLDGYLSLDTFNGLDTAVFDSINVQIINGTNNTTQKNQLGNLIIGYNENLGSAGFFCENEQHLDETACNGSEATWTNYSFAGSHNLILGKDNSFDNNASIVAGESNVSNQSYTSILGGQKNYVTASYATVTSGYENKALGKWSSVSGGYQNVASGNSSSVSGGYQNVASGNSSSISGGDANTARGDSSSVSGGYQNVASRTSSSVSGGNRNEALGVFSSVSGGFKRIAYNIDDWAAGSLSEDD